MNGEQVLLIPMTKENDVEARDIKDYLKQLLAALWNGTSRRRYLWEFDLFTALIEAKAIEGKLDENGFVQQLSDKERKRGEALIFEAINAL